MDARARIDSGTFIDWRDEVRTYVIAEAGSAHDNQLARALELVDIAKQVGADAVKFQYWSDPWALAAQRHLPEEAGEAYARSTLPVDWLAALSARAARVGIDFMCTAYLPQDVTTVAAHVSRFKVASLESEFRPLLREIARVADERRTYVSLGLATEPDVAMGEIAHAQFMHCVSAYPVPVDQLNLARLYTPHITGYSDHSDVYHAAKVWVGALAVAAGATVVEAHLRLDASLPHGADYRHSMPPAQFRDYVYGIRLAEAMRGTGAAWPAAAELALINHKSQETSDVEVTAAPAAGAEPSAEPDAEPAGDAGGSDA